MKSVCDLVLAPVHDLIHRGELLVIIRSQETEPPAGYLEGRRRLGAYLFTIREAEEFLSRLHEVSDPDVPHFIGDLHFLLETDEWFSKFRFVKIAWEMCKREVVIEIGHDPTILDAYTQQEGNGV